MARQARPPARERPFGGGILARVTTYCSCSNWPAAASETAQTVRQHIQESSDVLGFSQVGSWVVRDLFERKSVGNVVAGGALEFHVPAHDIFLSIPQVSIVARADLLLPIFSIHSYP